MADKLVFPIQFDIEKGLNDALSKAGNVSSRLEKALNRKFDLQVRLSDTSALQQIDNLNRKLAELQTKFAELGKSTGGGLQTSLAEAEQKAATLKTQMDAVVQGLINAGNAAKDQLKQFREATTAAEKLAKAEDAASAAQVKARQEADQKAKQEAAAKKAAEQAAKEKAAAEQKAAKEAEQAARQAAKLQEQNAVAELRAIANSIAERRKAQAENEKAAKDYVRWWTSALRQKEQDEVRAQKAAEQAAKAKWREDGAKLKEWLGLWNGSMGAVLSLLKQREAAQQKAIDAQQREQEAILRVLQALAAEENTINNISQKLAIYNGEIKNMQIGSDAWNRHALEIRKLTQELDVAQQRLRDFQQASFQGLSNDLTANQVAQLTKLREELGYADVMLNNLRAKGQLTDSSGAFTSDARFALEERKKKSEEISKILQDGSKMQLEYEKMVTKEKEEQLRRSMNANPTSFISGVNSIQQMQQLMTKFREELDKSDSRSQKFERLSVAMGMLSVNIENATMKMRAFQNEAFRGLDDTSIRALGEGLYKMQMQVKDVDQRFNQLRASAGAYDDQGKLTSAANDLLQERRQLTESIAKMTRTAGEEQLKLEQQINATQEKRKQALEQRKKRNDDIRKTLLLQENSIDNITKKLQLQQRIMQNSKINSSTYFKAAAEVQRLSAALKQAQQDADRLTSTAAKGGQKVSNTYREHSTYLSRLIQRMALYFSIQQVSQFLSKVREVTAQFELQRRSLGAILQSQEKGDALFGQIKSFAMQSPLSVLQLTAYTKKVAAYRIEYEKLFDTTKRLADVSVGLGVDMDRIVLAFGQVRAATYLRASELRQFTEAGIPMLELLAQKFTELNGRATTTGDVMNMIQKRMVKFSDVEQIFREMTDAGGIFYNMQQIQGDTLYGMWQKLGDAASMMYAEIGNNSWVNSAMKTLINTLIYSMRHIKYVGIYVGLLAAAIAVFALRAKLATVTQKGLDAATNRLAYAQQRYNIALQQSGRWMRTAYLLSLKSAMSYNAAAQAMGAWRTAVLWLKGAFQQLGAVLMKNIWTVVAVAALEIITYFVQASNEAKELQADIDKIQTGWKELAETRKREFTSLANEALSADNIVDQKKALDELKRTYGDMVPVSHLTIENLRAMNGNYKELTDLIEQYTIAKEKEKAVEQLNQAYSEKIANTQKKFREEMEKNGYTLEQAYRIIYAIQERVKEGQLFTKADRNSILGIGADEFIDGDLNVAYEKMRDTLYELNDAIKVTNEGYDAQLDALSKLPSSIREAKKALDELLNATPHFDVSEAARQQYIISLGNELKKAFGSKGLEFNDSWFTYDKDYYTKIYRGQYVEQAKINFKAIRNALGYSSGELSRLLDTLEKEYYKLVPSNELAQLFKDRLWEMTSEAGISMDKMQKMFWNGEGDVKDFAETVKEEIDQLEQDLTAMQGGMKYGLVYTPTGETIEQLQARINLLKEYYEFLKDFFKDTKTSTSRTADDRLSKLKEIEQALGQMYTKYKQLRKAQGDVFANTEILKLYADQLNYLNGLAKEFNLPEFEIPKTLDQLNRFRRQIKNTIETLRLKGYEKEALQIEMTIGSSNVDALIENIKKELDKIADELKRTQVIEEFYNKVLETTGSYSIADIITTNLFGGLNGESSALILKRKIRQMFKDAGVTGLDTILGDVFNGEYIDYQNLKYYADIYRETLGDFYKDIINIVDNGQKQLSNMYLNYFKEIDKAKGYAQQIVDLARFTQNRINAIQNDLGLTEDIKRRLISGYEARQQREQAKIEWAAFKNMPIYVQLFDDLENASRTALEDMRTRLTNLKTVWGSSLDPTALKEINKQLTELDKQIILKNPFKALRDSIQRYRELNRQNLEGNLIDATNKQIDALRNLQQQLEAENLAREKYEEAKSKYGAESPQVQAAYDTLLIEQEKTAEAQNRVEAADKEVENAQQMVGEYKKIKDIMATSLQGVLSYGETISKIAHSVASVVETLGGSEQDVQFFKDIAEGLDMILGGINDITTALAKGDIKGIVEGAITAIPNLIGGFVKIFSAGKIRAANKEIKKQEKILKQLEYTYNRLQSAADRLFGTDYISNYNRQVAILQAQQAAYLAQAEAERSKGKAKDQNAIDSYLEKAREVGDQIADMQDQLAQKFTDTTMTDAAKDFATAWLEAKASFASTTSTIKEKYRDLIKNLIIEGAAAKVIENALQPLWDRLNELLKGGDVTGAMQWLSTSIDSFVQQANDGMNVLWDSLRQAGIDVQKAFNGDTDLTGISREIANASEESINGLAQGINTQNYYISYVPQIAQEVSAIRVALQGGTPTSGAAAGWTDWQTQAMGHYAEIQRNTAETALRCEKAATACQEVADRLRRVVESKKSAIRTTIV